MTPIGFKRPSGGWPRRRSGPAETFPGSVDLDGRGHATGTEEATGGPGIVTTGAEEAVRRKGEGQLKMN